MQSMMRLKDPDILLVLIKCSYLLSSLVDDAQHIYAFLFQFFVVISSYTLYTVWV